MLKGLIDDVKSAAASFLGTYLARASVAVPFLVALGFATAAVALELTERFGARNALWMLAGGFCAIGLLAAFAVTMKEQQQEIEAAEEQRKESGIGEMTSAAATQAATQLPTALMSILQSPSTLSAILQSPSTSALPLALARMIGRNMPLVLLVVLVGLLLWPTEETEEGVEQDGESAKPGEQKAPSEEERLREAA